MNKELLDEIEFPDDIISFLKVKYPKAYTDQEKAVLKQTEQLIEEKKELKDIISKKREQAKFKSLPINVIPSDEAKEKAIKLVQDGTLLLSSKTKTIDLDEPTVESHNNTGSSGQKIKPRQNDDNKKIENSNASAKSSSLSNPGKIAFVSAGYAFNDEQSNKKTDDCQDQNLKRSLSLNSSFSGVDLNSKRNRVAIDEVSDSEDALKSSTSEKNVLNTESRKEISASNGSVLRFCGHNMQEDFVRRIVEPYGSVMSLEVEERCENSSNIVVTLESSEAARLAKEALDCQYLEGRVVNVYYKRGGGEFSQRRPYRRRRGRTDFGRGPGSGGGHGSGRFRFQRNEAFSQPIEYDKVLPSHFYSSGTEYEDNAANRKMRWSMSEEGDVSDRVSGDKTTNISSGSLKSQSERLLVQYNDLEPI